MEARAPRPLIVTVNMAVELLITNQETGARELVPVATSEVFRQYWMAGCEELNLRRVPLIADGLFERNDIPNLIRELASLAQWFRKTQTPHNAEALSARVSGVIGALERVIKDSKLTID